MADFWGSTITIGGALPKSLRPELMAAIKAELCDTPDDDVINEIDLSLEKDTTFQVYEGQARNGRFGGLEKFLKENGLVYSIECGANSEYAAELISWDGTQERCFMCDSQFNVVLPKEFVDDIIKYTKEFVAAPELLPLILTNPTGDWKKQLVARTMAMNTLTEPLTILELVLKERYPESSNLPAFELTD